jgi:hypothetical protein
VSIQKETELYEPIKAYFNKKGYSVKSEVRNCDLVAIHEEESKPIIVEFKKTLNISLLLQGLERQRMTPQVYIAIEYKPRKRGSSYGKWSEYTNLCKRLGLGLLTVQFYKRKAAKVELWCTPQDQPAPRPKQSIRTTRLLYEFNERSGDYNVGGSSQTEIVTAYRELALRVAFKLEQNGPTKLSELTKLIGHSKINSLMQKNFYGWFERAERGIYQLSPKGREALIQYEDIIRSLQQ